MSKTATCGSALVLSLFSAACSRGEMPKAVEATAAAIEKDFVEIHGQADHLVSQIGDVYSHLSRYDLSGNDLDEDKGGSFATFNNNAYYVNKNTKGAAYYASPRRPPDESFRHEVKILTYLEPFVSTAWNQMTAATFLFFGTSKPENIAIARPYVDVPSFFPPELQFGQFEWFQRGERSPDRAQWSREPFADLSSQWIMDISRGVKAHDVVKGVVVISISMAKLGRKHFSRQTERLWLVSPALSVVSASPAAERALELPVLIDEGPLHQMRENRLPANQFKLSDPSHEAGVRRLAARVSGGETDFRETVQGKTFRFFVKPVPEVGFYVVGASPR